MSTGCPSFYQGRPFGCQTVLFMLYCRTYVKAREFSPWSIRVVTGEMIYWALVSARLCTYFWAAASSPASQTRGAIPSCLRLPLWPARAWDWSHVRSLATSGPAESSIGLAMTPDRRWRPIRSEDGLKIVENSIVIGYLSKMRSVWESVRGKDDSDGGKSSHRDLLLYIFKAIYFCIPSKHWIVDEYCSHAYSCAIWRQL